MPELTNLLPEDRQRAMHRDYLYRLASTALFIFAVIIFASCILLYPSYRYLTDKVAIQQARLDQLNQGLANGSGQQQTSRLSTIEQQYTTLSALATSTGEVDIAREVFSVPHPGISLTDFALSTASGATVVTLSGTASTRDSLRAYYLVLTSAPFAASVDLPVSAYAAAAGAPFTLTITLL